MSSTIYYENLIADVYTPDRIVRFNYIQCTPPSRLKPRGTVILLHDFFKSSYQFRHVIDLFAMSGYTTIAPDFPGRTISRKSLTPPKISMRTLTSELSQFLRLIDIKAPVHFVGVGFGAHIATELAIQHSEVVASVTCRCDPHFTGDVRRLDNLLRIPAGASGKQLTTTLTQFFENTNTNTHSGSGHHKHKDQQTLSEDDIAEYLAPFSEPGRLLDLQQASKAVLKSQHALHDSIKDLADLNVRCLLLQPPEKEIFIKGGHVVEATAEGLLEVKMVDCDPEGRPESFVVAVVGYLRKL